MRDQRCCDAGPMTRNGASPTAARSASRSAIPAMQLAIEEAHGGPQPSRRSRRDQKRHFERRQRDDRVDEEPNLGTPGHRCYSRADAAPDEWLVKGRFSTTTRQLSQPA